MPNEATGVEFATSRSASATATVKPLAKITSAVQRPEIALATVADRMGLRLPRARADPDDEERLHGEVESPQTSVRRAPPSR